MLEKYLSSVEHQMQVFYSNLKEREQRHYAAALEAQKLPHGGQKYIQDLFDIHPKTLKRAIDELTHPELFASFLTVQQRRTGGGRKKTVHYPDTEPQLHTLIDRYKAGSPTQPDVYWIHLKPKEIAALYFN